MTDQCGVWVAARIEHAANVMEAAGMGTVTVADLRCAARFVESMPPAQFDSAEALAAWLETLHECDSAGMVGNRKWPAAQAAAKAARAALSNVTAKGDASNG